MFERRRFEDVLRRRARSCSRGPCERGIAASLWGRAGRGAHWCALAICVKGSAEYDGLVIVGPGVSRGDRGVDMRREGI